MNHFRNAVRLAIVVYWSLFAGLLFSAGSNWPNLFALGWSTWLFYVVAAVVAAYAGFFLTRLFWNVK